MRVYVLTTQWPDGRPAKLEHGPFRSFIEAEEYIWEAKRLRQDWGEITFEDRTPQAEDTFPRPLGAPPLNRREP